MAERFIKHNQERIVLITNNRFVGGIPLSKDLDHLSDKEIMEQCKIKNNSVVLKNPKIEIKDLKIAFVGVWNIPCGISTYLGYLIPCIRDKIKDYKIFCEIDDSVIANDKVIPCWRRGESLINLAYKIKEYEPDVVLIQHEYGIFPNARRWLSFLTSISEFKVFTTLHSIYKHQDKTICEAPIPNIIVHTDIAKDVLLKKGVSGNIHVIPHGCLPPDNKPRLWNMYHSKHTFMQFGFGFEYKGWENSLEACKILKEEFSDVFFTGLFSESKFNKHIHDTYYGNLLKIIKDFGIEDNVSLIRGFQTDEVLDSFLRINRCAVFPYKDNGEHTVYGVTGAARVAMKHGIPVITSTVPFFHDMNGVCPQVNFTKDLVTEIKNTWNNPKRYVESQNKFLINNSWDIISDKYLDVFIK